MLAWFLENTLVAGVLALLVALATRCLSPRPATAHLLWVAALCALLMPSLPWITTPGAELRLALRGWLAVSTAPEVASVPALPVPEALDPLGVADAPLSEPAAPDTDSLDDPAPPGRFPAWVRAPGVLEKGAMLLWLAGAVFVLFGSARRVLPFQRLVTRSAHAPRGLSREVREVAERLGVRAPEVRLVAGVASPSVWCLGRPRLLWPARAGGADAPRARRALIAHELAHLARRDHWVSWLEIPAAALAWWNPLFWWIRGRIRHYAELSCDAWAVWAYPADRRLFAEALIDMQARTRTAPVALQGLGATDSECKDFERRLDMIMKKGKFPGVSKGVASLAAAIAVLASPGFTAGGSGGDSEAGSTRASHSTSFIETRSRSVELGRKVRELLGAGKQGPELLAVLQELVALDPENGWAHSQIGRLQLAAGEFADATKSFTRQSEIGYDRPTAFYNAGCASARANDKRRAFEYMTAAVSNGFANADLMEKDTDLDSLRTIGRFKELVQQARTAGELKKELARLEKEGNTEMFLAAHGELAALLTRDGKLQAEHGDLALKAGDTSGSALAFGRQIEAGHDIPMAYYCRACARARGGDTRGALSDLREAAERGMGYPGVAEDTDLDSLRKLPGFDEIQARIVAKAASGRELRTLLVTQNEADIPALAKLVADESKPKGMRGTAALTLGKLELAKASYADAYATFERAAGLGADVRLSAFGMAEALAGAGKEPEALRHAQLALDLGYANPDALGKLLERSALASPAEAEEMLARAERAQAMPRREYAAEKAWAAGMNERPAPPSTKAASE